MCLLQPGLDEGEVEREAQDAEARSVGRGAHTVGDVVGEEMRGKADQESQMEGQGRLRMSWTKRWKIIGISRMKPTRLHPRMVRWAQV